MYGDTDVMRKHVEPAARAGRRDPLDGRPARRPGRGGHLGRPRRRLDAGADPRARQPAARGRRPARPRRRHAREPHPARRRAEGLDRRDRAPGDRAARRRRPSEVRAARAGPQGLAGGHPARRPGLETPDADHRPRATAPDAARPARRAAAPGRPDPARAAVRRRVAPTAPRCPSTCASRRRGRRRPRRPARRQPRLGASRRRTPRRSPGCTTRRPRCPGVACSSAVPTTASSTRASSAPSGCWPRPTVAVDLDVAAGPVQVKSWHRQSGGAVAALSTAGRAGLRAGVVPDVGLGGRAGPRRRRARGPAAARLGRPRPASTSRTSWPTPRSRPPAPTAPTSSRCWWSSIPVRSPTAPVASSPTARRSACSPALATEARGRLRALVADVSGAETTTVGVRGLDAGRRRVARPPCAP